MTKNLNERTVMPAKDTGTVNIHGKEYKTVASRVQAFRETVGLEWAIVTEIIDRDGDEVVMKATIQTLDGRVVATGHAEEKRTSSQINRTSALENAETSAIGRALAAFGLAGTEYASADEVAQAITQQRAPAPRAVTSSTAEAVMETMTSDQPPMTLAQRGKINLLAKKLNLDPDETSARLKQINSYQEASEAITKLETMLEERDAKLN